MTDITPSGVILIDKPSGWTSHDVVAKVRSVIGVKKVGHAGTLDPLATGLLIVLVGRQYTKRQAEFMKLDKEYICTAQLGVTTDTYDRTGQITSLAKLGESAPITLHDLQNTVTSHFLGQINQTVPAYSAVKRNGKKLYEQARAGTLKEAELPSRVVTITEFSIIDFISQTTSFETSFPDDNGFAQFTTRIRCSSGTYIRSLIHDIGQRLKVGATVMELRRTKIGEFSISQAIELNPELGKSPIIDQQFAKAIRPLDHA